MSFSVNARALGGLSDAMDRRAHELTGAANFLEDHAVLHGGAGLPNDLLRTHERITGQVTAFLRRASYTYAEEYARRIGSAVAFYQRTDDAARTRIDATMPGPDPPTQVAPLAGPDIFDDPACLTLISPPDCRAEFPYRPCWYDLLSPSSIIRDTVWGLSWLAARLGLLDRAYDPYEAFTVPLCGDWAGLERTSYALAEVAKALFVVRDRTAKHARVLNRIWTGNSAGACGAALEAFARDLRTPEDTVIEIASQYHRAATTAREQGERLASTVTVMIDVVSTVGADSLMSAVTNPGRLKAAAEEISTLVPLALRSVEVLHAGLDDVAGILRHLGDVVGYLDVKPFAPDLPSTVPYLPSPAMAPR